MDSPLMDGPLSEADIWLSRQSVAAARSQALIRSWATARASAPKEDDSDEDDFKYTRESAGVDAVNKDDDPELDNILKSKRTNNEQLLENLLGKKAAAAKRKADATKKSTLAASKPKPSARPDPDASDSEDEDVGSRSAAFSSKKKTGDNKSVPPSTAEGDGERLPDPDAPTLNPQMESAKQAGEQERVPTKKRKATSYLDEVLGQKKGKKKKQKAGAV